MRKAKKLLAGILAAVVTMTGTGVSFMAENVAVVYAAEPTLSVSSEAVYEDGAFQVDFEKSIRLTASVANNGGNEGTVDSVSYEWSIGGTKSNGNTFLYDASSYPTSGVVKVTLNATVVYRNNGVTTAVQAKEQNITIKVNKKTMKKDDAQAMAPNFGIVYIGKEHQSNTVKDTGDIIKYLGDVLVGANKYGTYEVSEGQLVAGKPSESWVKLNYTLNENCGYEKGWKGEKTEVVVSNINVVADSRATTDEPAVKYLAVKGTGSLTDYGDVANVLTSGDVQKLLIGKADTDRVKVYGTGNVPCIWESNSSAISIQGSGTNAVTITAVSAVKDTDNVQVKVTPVFGKNSITLTFGVQNYVDHEKVTYPGDIERVYDKSAAETYLSKHVTAPFKLGETISAIKSDGKKGETYTLKEVLPVGTYTVDVTREMDDTLEDYKEGVVQADFTKSLKITVKSGDFVDVKWPELETTSVACDTEFEKLFKGGVTGQSWDDDANDYEIDFVWMQNTVGDLWTDVSPNAKVTMDTDWRKLKVVARVKDGLNYTIPSDKAYKTDYAFVVVPAKLTATLSGKSTDETGTGRNVTSETYVAGNSVELTATIPTAFKTAGYENNFKVEWYKDGKKLDAVPNSSQFTRTVSESGKYSYVVTLEKKDYYQEAKYDLSVMSATSNEIEVVCTNIAITGKNQESEYGTAAKSAAKVGKDGEFDIISYESYYVSQADGTKSATQSYNVGVTTKDATMQCLIPADLPVGKYDVYFNVKIQDGNNVFTLRNKAYTHEVKQKNLSIATKAIKVSNAVVGGKVSDAVIEYTVGSDKDLINKGIEFKIADNINFDTLGTLKNVKVVATLKDTHNFKLDTKDAVTETFFVDITVTKAPLTLAPKAVNVTEDDKVVFELENVPAGIDAAKVVYTVTDKLGKVVTANADGSYPIGEYTVTPAYTLDSTAAAVSEVKPVASKLVVVAGHKSHKAESVSQKVIPATTESAGFTVDVCKDCDGKEIEGTKKVLCAAIDASSVATKFTTYNYTGAEVKPGIIVKSKTGRRISAANFDVTYKNNTEVGTASYTITFKGNYSGTLTGTFRIVPSGVAALKVVSGENGFTANWSESKGATGYQVVYKSKSCRTTMQMATDTTITVKDARIKAGEVVYVYVKGYKAEDGVQYTSKNWKRRGVKAL